jgi:hypothetical protein
MKKRTLASVTAQKTTWTGSQTHLGSRKVRLP